MGIPGFFREIAKDPSVLFWDPDVKTEHFFMDYNAWIYGCEAKYMSKHSNKLDKMNKVSIEKGIIEQIVKDTINVVTEIVRPSKLLYLAFDGPPPRAKIEQQRLRRYKGVEGNAYIKKLKDKYGMVNTSEYFNTTLFSPGTVFMGKLSNALQKAIKENKFKSDKNDKDFKVILSDTTVVGEGEHKIIPYIKHNLKSNSDVCIFSDDADLILLCMTLASKQHKIKILKTQSIPDEYKEGGYVYLKVNDVENKLYDFIGLNGYDKVRVLYDYVFIMSLFGDDFIKRLPSLLIYKHSKMIVYVYRDTLNKHKKHLVQIKKVNNNKHQVSINNKFFMNVLIELSKKEQTSLQFEQTALKKRCGRNYTDRDGKTGYDFDIGAFDHSLYCQEENPFYDKYHNDINIINYFQEKHLWKKQYYEYFFGLKNNNYNSGRSKICKAYLESLRFTIDYYINSVPPSWSYFYPYRVAPFVSDLITNLNHKMNINKINLPIGKPCTPFQQLMLIIPPQLSNILPKEYASLMTNKTSPIIKYFPTTFELDVAFGLIRIKSEPILEEINDKKIFEAMDSIDAKLNSAQIKRNTLSNDLIF
jgi:5'-3' exonuclease